MSELIRIREAGEQAAREALEACIVGGGVAVFPADGLYGLACDPLSSRAVRRLQEMKGRPDRKPSAVMYFSPLAMRELVDQMGERTRAAAAGLLPGPFTLVIPNPEHRYPLACREDPERLGVRLIEGPLSGARCPVMQTSANFAGEAPPRSFGDVALELVMGADLALDGGELTGLPSTVVDLSGFESGEWAVLREGAVGEAELARRLRAL